MATKPPNGIYTFSGRPGSSYKYENNQWFVSNSGTKNQYVPMQDPTGNRAKTLEAGLKSGKTQFTQILPTKSSYNQLTVSTPADNTRVIQDNGLPKDIQEVRRRQEAAQRAFEESKRDEIKAAPEYSTLDKIENIVRNPLVAASYAMQPGDFAMPMNYSEFERSPNYQDDVWNNNLVGRGLNAASYFHPAGLIAHGIDNAMYTGTDVKKAINSGELSDWKQAGMSALNTGLDLLAGSKFIGGSGRLLNTGENATLKAMQASNKLNLPASVNTTLGTKVFPKFASSPIKSADDLALSKIFPQINPNSIKYNPVARNAYNNAVGIGNAQNVVEATAPIVDFSKVEKPSEWLSRYQLANQLKNEGLIPTNIASTAFGRSKDVTGLVTKEALERANTVYRATTPNISKVGAKDIMAMLDKGVDLSDEIAVAEYMNTHVPYESYGYRANPISPGYGQDLLYTGNYENLEEAAKGLSHYGTHISELRPNLDFTTGTPQEWFQKYYQERPFIFTGKGGKNEGLGSRELGWKEGAIATFPGDKKYYPFVGNKGSQLLNAISTTPINKINYTEVIPPVSTAKPSSMFKSGLGNVGMDMSMYTIKNPDYYTQLLNTYDKKALSATNRKFYKDLIATVKKQDGLVTERQLNELKRLATGNFDFGSKGYNKGYAEGGSLAKNIPTYYDYSGTPIYRDTTALPFPDGGYLSLQNAMLGPLPEREKPNSVLAYNKFVEATKTPNQSAYIKPSYSPESNHYKYGFFGTNSGNIYGGAGYGLPKYGLEANVFGSIPAQSDPYYKGFYSAQLAKQFGNNRVGLGVSSPVVGYTDDSGFHMNRLELSPQLSFRKNFAEGGKLNEWPPKKSPILYVTNPKDPRLIAYNDRLNAYNKTQNVFKALNNLPTDYSGQNFRDKHRIYRAADDELYKFMNTHSNIKPRYFVNTYDYLKLDGPMAFDLRIGIPVFEKPVQQVIYKKPELEVIPTFLPPTNVEDGFEPPAIVGEENNSEFKIPDNFFEPSPIANEVPTIVPEFVNTRRYDSNLNKWVPYSMAVKGSIEEQHDKQRWEWAKKNIENPANISYKFADGGILDRIRKRLNTKEEEKYNPSKDLSLLHKYNSEVKQIQDLEESDPRRVEYEKANSQFVLDKAKYDEALKSYEDQLLLFNEYNNLDPRAKLQISPEEFIRVKRNNKNIEEYFSPEEFASAYSKNYSGIGSAEDFKRIIPDYNKDIFNTRRLLNNPDYYIYDGESNTTDEDISYMINKTKEKYKNLYPNTNTVGFFRELNVMPTPFYKGKNKKYTVPTTPQVENYINYKTLQKIFPNIIDELYADRTAWASNTYSSGYDNDKIILEDNSKLAINTYSENAGRTVPYYKPEFLSYEASNLYSPYPEFSQPNPLSPAPVAPSSTYEERVYPYVPVKVYNSKTNTWENRVAPKGSLQEKYTKEAEAWRLRNGNNPSSHLPLGQAPGGTFADGGPLNDKTNHGKILDSVYASAIGDYYASGGMLKRADGSYSRRGLWDNIRAAAARNKAQGKPGKAPTKEMLEQAKVSSKANGGFVAGRQMYQPLDIRESYGGFLYGNGGQFPTTFSLPEDSFKQGGNNLHDSVYASSMAQYPAVYSNGGSILSMSNTPELSGEGKDLSVPENAYIYSAGGSIKKFKK